jgi:hypothetical protein
MLTCPVAIPVARKGRMADSKQVAEQLQEFTEAAYGVIPRRGLPTQVYYGSSSKPSFRNRTEVYGACIAKLDESDRDELARILEAMFSALGSL